MNAHKDGTRRHRSSRRWTDDGGSVAAETAIVIPTLVAVLVLVAVLIARGVDARLRIDDAAHQAARAASLTRSAGAATTAATQTVQRALAQAHDACPTPTVDVDTGGFRPGGVVTVTVTCRVDLSQAALLGVPATRTLTAAASSPVDTWRGLLTTGPGSP